MHLRFGNVAGWLALGFVVMATGCSKEAASPPNANAPVVKVQETPPPEGNTEPPLADVSDAVNSIPDAAASGSDPGKIGVKLMGPADYADLVGKHKGKVVLVDFWATWCGPCVKAFPHTVDLSEKHAEQGLAVISVSLDDPDSKGDVEEFLIKAGAKFENYQCKLGDAEKSLAAYDLGESIPHLKLYDRTGKLRKSFATEDDFKTLDATIAMLLAE